MNGTSVASHVKDHFSVSVNRSACLEPYRFAINRLPVTPCQPVRMASSWACVVVVLIAESLLAASSASGLRPTMGEGNQSLPLALSPPRGGGGGAGGGGGTVAEGHVDSLDKPALRPQRGGVPTNTLPAGGTLNAGEGLVSTNGKCSFDMQGDGNLVHYCGGRAVWDSNTRGNNRATMQRDGNLVLYDNGNNVVKWASNTNGNTNCKLTVQNDGNAVIYCNGKAAWSSRGWR